MDEYARPARENGKIAIQGYMALAKKTHANRSEIFPPTIHAVTYSRIAMEAANIPKVEVRARKKSSEPKMKVINAALRNVEQGDGDVRPHSYHQWMHQNFDKCLLGTGFRFQGYHLQTRKIHVKNSQGKWVEKTSIVHDDIIDLVPDFFHVGVSRDAQMGLFGASSCYWDRFYKRDAFMEQFDTEYYDNIKAVVNSAWFSETDYVRVRFYWNIYKDLYYVCALPQHMSDDLDEVMESSIPIRKDWILDYGDPSRPKKFLPISSIHNDYSYDFKLPDETSALLQAGRLYQDVSMSSTSKSFWSKSDPYLIRAMAGFKKSLWGAAADHTKASSVHFLMSSSSGILDQINTANLYGILPLKGDINAFDVKSLTEKSNFLQKWAEMDEATDSAMTYALGNDWRRAATELTNEKATVAAIRQQVQRLRSSLNLKQNETGPVQRHYRITVNLIQQYYPEPTLIDLADGEIPDGVDEDDVIRDLDGFPVKARKLKEIPFDMPVVEKKKGDRFTLVSPDSPELSDDEKGKGDKMIKMRSDYVRTEEEPEIYLEPGSTFAELQSLEKSLSIEKMQAYQFWLGLQYQTGEVNAQGQPVIAPLIPREGAQELLSSFAETWDDDPEKVLGKTEADTLEKPGEEIPEPFAPPPQPIPDQQGQQQGQPMPQKGIGNPLTAQATQLAQAVTL